MFYNYFCARFREQFIELFYLSRARLALSLSGIDGNEYDVCALARRNPIWRSLKALYEA